MKRRTFIVGLGSAATWPVVARAQQAAVPVVGYLLTGAPQSNARYVAAVREGLSESGFIEGRNVAIEYSFANNVNDRLPELAADLVRRRVTVILASTLRAALAAKAATATIPIVFRTGADPVQYGLVASFNEPGGNVTGINDIGLEISVRGGWGYCATCCQLRHALPCSSIPPPHPLNQASLRLKSRLRP